MTGTLVLVVGPSGAGKDSVLRFAANHFRDDRRLVFPRRVITRPADRASEDHDTVTEDVFLQRLNSGAFALNWQAHGLSYGIPKIIETHLAQDRLVAVNVSRTILETIGDRFAKYLIVEITASPEILTARIAARARKTDGDVQQRVTREVKPSPQKQNHVTLMNEGTLIEIGTAFCDLLLKLQSKDALDTR